jgi:hypothetical protein
VRIIIARIATIVGLTLLVGGAAGVGTAVADRPGMTHDGICRSVTCMTHN